MLRRIGVLSTISSDPAEISNADKLILPGVGHYDYGMRNLNKSGLVEVLTKKVMKDKTPILGICLGAQLLGNQSEEGIEKGLGWIDMDVIKFDVSKMDNSLKVPHMGWREVLTNKDSALFEGMYENPRFYFVHSFFMSPKNLDDILCSSVYGSPFTSVVQHKNIYGVQFHPEKSHKFGMKVLENFTKLQD